jgi:hypothetical protein
VCICALALSFCATLAGRPRIKLFINTVSLHCGFSDIALPILPRRPRIAIMLATDVCSGFDFGAL